MRLHRAWSRPGQRRALTQRSHSGGRFRPHLGEWRRLRQADHPVDDNTLDRARDLRLIGGSGPCSKDRVEQRVEHLRQTELLSIDRVLRDDAGRAGGV